MLRSYQDTDGSAVMSPDDIDVQILETEILLDQTHAEVWFDTE